MRTLKIAIMAACSFVLSVGCAHASELFVTINWTAGQTWLGQATTETFDLNTAAGEALGSDYVWFPITNDSQGMTNIAFGDSHAYGDFGASSIQPSQPSTVYQLQSNYFFEDFFTGNETAPASSPPFYSGAGVTIDLTPGVTYTAYEGSTLTAAVVPEPATWAMMLLGLGLVGGCLRMARRSDEMAPTA